MLPVITKTPNIQIHLHAYWMKQKEILWFEKSILQTSLTEQASFTGP